MDKIWSLLRKIRGLLNSTWEVKINHIYWKIDRCTYIITHVGCSITTDTLVNRGAGFS